MYDAVFMYICITLRRTYSHAHGTHLKTSKLVFSKHIFFGLNDLSFSRILTFRVFNMRYRYSTMYIPTNTICAPMVSAYLRCRPPTTSYGWGLISDTNGARTVKRSLSKLMQTNKVTYANYESRVCATIDG